MIAIAKEAPVSDQPIQNDAIHSEPYINMLTQFLEKRCVQMLQMHFEGKQSERLATLPQPSAEDHSPLASFMRRYDLSSEEAVMFLSALVPNVIPGFFDAIVHRFITSGGEFPEFGGVKGQNHRGTLPTGETILFLIAGTDPESRLYHLRLFDEDQFLFHHRILSIKGTGPYEPSLSGRIVLEKEFLEVFTTGRIALPKLSMEFPAEHISTDMEWDDLVLNTHTLVQIHEIEHWVKHHETLMKDWGMQSKLKPGYRTLFYGPPGTGKTLTAMLLGKYTEREVFRIDLSMVVSKYIGETEKNLASLFARAEHKNWILFFDEADAIFAKRTGVRDAHDKYANQEVSYLLQRIESHTGLCILASNFRNNIDQAFVRRFHSVVYFPTPGYEEKLLLWQKAFPSKALLDVDVRFETLAVNHELTGAQIMNIIQYTCLQSLAGNTRPITMDDIDHGIRRELAKEGR